MQGCAITASIVPICKPARRRAIAQLRSVDVIQPVRSQSRQRRKMVNDVLSRLRAGESLQQFLQDETRDHDRFTAFQRVAQYANLGGG
jgi:hypothetical protein